LLERDTERHTGRRDPGLPVGTRVLYRSLAELKRRFAAEIRGADLTMVGSYLPEGATLGAWVIRISQGVTAYYDVDTPETLSRLARGEVEFLTPGIIPRYDLYFSSAGGSTVDRLAQEYGAREAVPLYHAVDPHSYFPEPIPSRYDLGYTGGYSPGLLRRLTHLLLLPARSWWSGRFVVVGSEYPATLRWPANVRRIEQLPPTHRRSFYNSQRFALNLTSADVGNGGGSPDARLFEAAACGIPIISDVRAGLTDLLCPGSEILLAESTADILGYVRDLPEETRLAVGARGRGRIMAEHTTAHRSAELERHVLAALSGRPSPNATNGARPLQPFVRSGAPKEAISIRDPEAH
jgi:spore maturation protein CgeB